MPACNFGSSEYITLGLLISYNDVSDDDYYKERAMEIWEEDNPDWNLDEDGNELPEDEREEPDIESIIDDLIYNDIQYMYEDDFNQAEYLIEKSNFNFINVEVESGYYEGAWLRISMDSDEVEDEDDRERLYQEIGKLGELLCEFADMGWRTVSSTCYYTSRGEYEETLADISEAIQEMMQDARDIEIYDYNDPANDWED